jgi:predicted transcriptional regulator
VKNKVVTAHIPVTLAEERHRLTLEAMADVDNGNVIDHQSVLAWASSFNTDKPLPLPQSK